MHYIFLVLYLIASVLHLTASYKDDKDCTEEIDDTLLEEEEFD